MSDDVRNNEQSGVHSLQRVSLSLTFEARDSINRMQALSGVQSKAQVVKNALRLYEWYLKHKQAGHRLIIEEGEEMYEVELDFT